MTKDNKRTILVILDGWGIGDKTEADAIFHTDTPYIDSLTKNYPHSQLKASGKEVGLPEGQMGNSEVGHLNIGAGRVVYQNLVRINNDIEKDTIKQNNEITDAFEYAKKNNKAVHFLGLISNGGVHSSEKHIYKLCDMTKEYGIENVYVHALTDGRDTDPFSGKGYVAELEDHLKKSNGQIASLAGRYYTMDRDKRWERIKAGYDLLLEGKGEPTKDILGAIQKSYDDKITDEFIKPIVKVDDDGEPVGLVKEGDVFFCFNFRPDRMRQITTVLTQQDMPEEGMKTMPLHYVTMTNYDSSFKNVHIAYGQQDIHDSMGEVIARAGKSQLRIAETEKYAHVTYFFSGGREEVFNKEKRKLIPSPKVATYDLKPEMSAYEVKDTVVKEIGKKEHDFICLNFANGDMVGHTGFYDAITKAIQTVDACVKEVVGAAKDNGYDVLIIADHGNAELAKNPDGSPNTAHSVYPVPCILVSDKYESIENGILADVAPTLLTIMGFDIPAAMTGKSLVGQ